MKYFENSLKSQAGEGQKEGRYDPPVVSQSMSWPLFLHREK
jgi:hypothetical protein